jgi:hypothetical protein
MVASVVGGPRPAGDRRRGAFEHGCCRSVDEHRCRAGGPSGEVPRDVGLVFCEHVDRERLSVQELAGLRRPGQRDLAERRLEGDRSEGSDSGAVRTAVVDVATAHHGHAGRKESEDPSEFAGVHANFGLPVWGGYTEHRMTAVTAVRSSGRTVHPVSATRASVALQGTHTVSWIGQIAGAESHARASGDIRRLMLTLSSVMSVQDWAATAGRSRVQRAPVQAAVKYQGSAAPPSRPPRLRTRRRNINGHSRITSPMRSSASLPSSRADHH